jgi:hypothetical protein
MLTPPIYRVMSYFNGSNIFLSSIYPFSYDTQELQSFDIHVVISLLEELAAPDFVKQSIPSTIKHYYYSLKDHPEQMIEKYHDSVFTHLYNSLERGKNVLLHCRNGESLCVAILIGFFIQCVRWGEKYLIYDYLNYIPKYFDKWTDSFLYFIEYNYPPTKLRHEFKQQLYDYERKILSEEMD